MQQMNGVGSSIKALESGRRRLRWPFDAVLRFLGLVFTLVAAVVVGADNESKIISVTLIKSLPPIHFYASAKWQYLSAFKYFVVSNCIACAYAAVSLVYSVATKGYKDNPMKWMLLMTFDLIMVGLLFSADGAAAAIGVIGRAGNSHMQWIKVCGFFEGYCHHFTAALVISIAGSVMFLCLVVLSALNLYKK
ncbi:CASP-like protein 1E1 [Cucurbita argyrosperma subsp. argyrosperma]